MAVIGEPKKSFGKILHFNRKARNLTIKQLEKKSGVSASFISRIENDSANPSVEVITKLARALGMPLSDFFHDQRGGKLLYPLRLSQARCLQDPKVMAFIDKLKSLPPEQRHAVLSIAGSAINFLRATLTPAGNGLYKLNAETVIQDGEFGDDDVVIEGEPLMSEAD
ncbi:MAG: helix-turn-helix transcriptional regulator [Candidatus Eremiobacteraeota bacterium]|nr:helix-turn-helix transcriptional regulator [Candidatus Eremiobacteraeota bacterium]